MKKWIYLAFLLSLSFMIAMIYQAYTLKAQTHIEREEVDRLISQILIERQEVATLQAEWAYLNGPERLAALVAARGKTLQLVQLQGKQLVESPR